MFQLRDPAKFTSFPNALTSQLNGLIDFNITSALEDHVADLTAFARTLRGAISSATFELPQTFQRNIVIAIPKPGSPTPPWHTVSASTARAFWSSAIDANGNPSHSAVVSLSPEDMYVFGGESGTFACSATESEIAPVIRRAAFYLDTLDPPQNQLSLELPTRAAGLRDVTFPIVGSKISLEPDDARGAPMSLPVIAGGAGEAIDKFAPQGLPDVGLGAGAGLSPFTSFQIDLSGLASPNTQNAWASTQAVYLVFSIERNVSLDLPDIETVCVLR